MAQVTLRKVVKKYDEVLAVRGIDLDIMDKEFVVLVGPSGCGKSTTLRMIAGLEEITDGDIAIGGDVVNDVPPKDRDIAMVFQNYALYPHMNVYENMSFGLKLKRTPKDVIDQRVRQAAQILDITELLDRKPKQLSGGQRQRVAMGRAIVRDPKVFLFDEPLSNLDAKLRVSMRGEIKALHQRLKTTTIYVTHDQIEAMTMADRIVVLRDGRIVQVGTPLDLYDHPANVFVAQFIGSPAMNLLPAKLATDGGRKAAVIDGGAALELPQQIGGAAGQAILLGIRPEHITIGQAADALPAKVSVVEPMGAQVQIETRVAGHEVTALLNERIIPAPGSAIGLVPNRAMLHAFDAASGQRL